MLLFAHTVLTLGAATAVDLVKTTLQHNSGRRRPLSSLNIDVRLLLVGSMLPDIDKIIGIYLFPNISNGRVFLHTLLFFVVLTITGLVIAFKFRKTWGLVLAAGTLSHLILDSMWRNPHTLFWPSAGSSFQAQDSAGWVDFVLHQLFTNPTYCVPEIAGGGYSALVFRLGK
jgi:membrane-bound metal-dependent hydrolase YbcI (DUF457 family)